MIFGTVINFRDDREFGFIKRDDHERDVYVHAQILKRAGLDSLSSGQRVEFDVEPDRRDLSGQKMRASKLRLQRS
jgi:CspA family cold shock protein